jgi:F0F1-type ATP synthase epsilon subunit
MPIIKNILSGDIVYPTKKQLTLVVKNRQNVVFQSPAYALSSENEIGSFDVLPEHANFISLIRKHIVIHRLGAPDFEIPISAGIMKVWKDQVNVYLDIFSALSS